MSEKNIPEHVDPYRLAEQNLHIDGTLKLIDMHRLAAGLAESSEPVKVSLEFGVDEQKITYMRGHLETTLSLQCQRCMEPYSYEIISDFALGVVTTLEEADALPERYEPAMAKDGQLALRELIEEEIILNLPIIPKHEPEHCKVTMPTAESGEAQGKGKNPFHVLESLKHKQQ